MRLAQEVTTAPRPYALTFISTSCDAIVNDNLVPRSFHIAAVPLSAAARERTLHLRSRGERSSRYPRWSPAQYFRRACMISSSNGSTVSKRCDRAWGGSTFLRTAKRFAHSADVWLNSRSRERQLSRRYQSYRVRGITTKFVIGINIC